MMRRVRLAVCIWVIGLVAFLPTLAAAGGPRGVPRGGPAVGTPRTTSPGAQRPLSSSNSYRTPQRQPQTLGYWDGARWVRAPAPWRVTPYRPR
jgi:hypothetical protein